MIFRKFCRFYTVWLCISFKSRFGLRLGLGDGSQEVIYRDADVGDDFGCTQKFGEPFAEVERDVVASGVHGCHIG